MGLSQQEEVYQAEYFGAWLEKDLKIGAIYQRKANLETCSKSCTIDFVEKYPKII